MAAGARKVNWFAIWTSVAVVVALVVVAGVVVWMNAMSGPKGDTPDATPSSAIVDVDTGAIAVGTGPNELATYIDFMCPICGQFEELYGPTIEALIQDEAITLNIHPISILDRASQGTQFSTRSAAAMYCVADADPDNVLPFMNAMFANQPSEGSRGLSDSDILGIASAAGVSGIDDCVNEGRYMKYVTAMTEETPVAPGNAGIGTPTVLLNGEFVSLTGDPEADLVAPLLQ